MNVTVEIPDQLLADTLCSGMEGGIGYWCQIEGYIEPKTWHKFMFQDQFIKHVDYPMNQGGAVKLRDTNTDIQYELTLEKLHEAVRLMAHSSDYRNHFLSILDETQDATTGDVLVQFAIFGGVIYG